LAFLVVYTTYEEHFPIQIDLMGLNLTNLLFFVVLVLIKLKHTGSSIPAPLKNGLLLYFATLIWAFFIGLVADASQMADDLSVLKSCIFYPLLFFLFYHAVHDLRAIRLVFAAILLTVML